MKHIYLASPNMSAQGYEQQYVKEAFDSNWLSTVGPNLNAFETEMKERVEAGAAVALSSGTAAIHLALKAIGIKTGDKVACQSLTFAATINPAIYQGAVPVFIDSDTDTWNMSPAALKKALEENSDIKAVIAVHLYGIPASLDEIRAICEEHNVILVEDAAESLGSNYKGRPTGSFGDVAVLSFNGNKIITTTCGGMFLCNMDNSQEVADKVRFWSTQAKNPARYYQHTEIGYNYRMSNVLAGIGRGQLKVLDERIKQKKAIFEFYKKELNGLKGVSFMPEPKDCDCNYWLSCILLEPSCGIKPIDIIEALEKQEIESRHIWKPMQLQPVFSDCKYYDNGGVSEYLFENGVCLPSDTNMTEEDLQRIVEIVKSLW